jgi:hypothetical protein
MNSTIKIDTRQTYRLNNRVLLKDDGDDVLAFDPKSLSIHQLNASLALVAKLCDGEQSCEQIVVAVMDAFSLDSKQAAKAVYESLSLLSQHNLLEAA